MSRHRKKGTAWLAAKSAIATAAKAHLGDDADIDVGWVRKIGDGLFRDVYAASVDAYTDDGQIELDAAALLPRWDAPRETDDGARREAALLREFANLEIPFRIPGWAQVVEESRRTILVRECLPGIPLDAFIDRRTDIAPWEVIGELAAEVHAIPAETLESLLPAHATRRAHAEACLEEVDEIAGDPVADDAVAWIRAHLPPDVPAKLIHGDLLGQNILLDFENPLALIDWEYSRLGDPAYDLAIVTRGRKQPFKRLHGLQKLLDAYNEAAEQQLRPADIHVYEIYLYLTWFMESSRGEGRHPPEVSRQRLQALLRRIEK
jgi:aminoglycoside phosphotransferase (APT) family kinase protein